MFKEEQINSYEVGISGISAETAADTDFEQIILEGRELSINNLGKIKDEKIRNVLIANIEKIKEVDLSSIQEEEIARDGSGYYIISENDCHGLEVEFTEEGCDVECIEKAGREIGLIIEK